MKTDLEKLLRTADAESLAPALNAVKPQKLDKETKAALAAAVSPTVKTKAPAETKGVKKPAFNFLKPVAVIALCAVLVAGVGLGVVGGLRNRNDGNGGLPVSSDVGATSATPSMGGTESAPPWSGNESGSSESTSSDVPSSQTEVKLPDMVKNAPLYLISNSGNSILETDDFIITLVGADFDAQYGPRIDFTLECKVDKWLLLHCIDTTVNGMSVECNMGEDYPEINDALRVRKGVMEFNVFADYHDVNNLGIKISDVYAVGAVFQICEVEIIVPEDPNEPEYPVEHELVSSVYVVYNRDDFVTSTLPPDERAVSIKDGDIKITVDGLQKYDPNVPYLRVIVNNTTDSEIFVKATVYEADTAAIFECAIPADTTGQKLLHFAIGYDAEERALYGMSEQLHDLNHFLLSFTVKDADGNELFTTGKFHFNFIYDFVIDYNDPATWINDEGWLITVENAEKIKVGMTFEDVLAILRCKPAIIGGDGQRAIMEWNTPSGKIFHIDYRYADGWTRWGDLIVKEISFLDPEEI